MICREVNHFIVRIAFPSVPLVRQINQMTHGMHVSLSLAALRFAYHEEDSGAPPLQYPARYSRFVNYDSVAVASVRQQLDAVFPGQ